MTKLLQVDGAKAKPFQGTGMKEEGLLEREHLERWIIDNPEVIDPDMKIITNEYDQWISAAEDKSSKRLDILGLSKSGDLAVIELKRDGDEDLHLQALTYAALASNFKPKTLAKVYARWLYKQSNPGCKLSEEQEEETARPKGELKNFLDINSEE